MAAVASLALVGSGAALTAAPARAASGGSFTSSFETSDPQPEVSTPLTPSTTVTGTSFPAGSLLGHVRAVTADNENPPNEVAPNLADANPTTKWLAFASTGVITYQLDAAETVKAYSLTSANDAPGRDPRAFTVEGSNDGKNWTPVDSESNQSFSDRETTNDYTVAAPGSYSWYRLDITQNSGDSITQLADWSISDGTKDPEPPTPMVTTVGTGPVSGPNVPSNVGFSGTHALRYSGYDVASGEASATNTLYDGLSLGIDADSVLSYKIFPESGGDKTYPATYAAIDLQLSDGSLVSAHGDITDEYGNPISAKGQGEGKVLFADQWNSVRVPLGALAGRTVTKILFTYDNDNPAASSKTHFQGWIDDIDLDPSAGRISGASLTNYVDTRRGTNSSGSFSRGNNIPATAVPNGFNFWTPMTDAASETWEYEWQQENNSANLPMLQGIGISHEPSPWMGDRDQLAIMPSTTGAGSAPDATLANRAQAFDHGNEIARPELYSVKLNDGMTAAVTPTDHGAVLRFTFPSDNGSVIFDGVGPDEHSSIDVNADGTVTGWTDGGSGLSVGATRMYFSGTFDTTPASVGTAAGNRSGARYAAFSGLKGDHVVELRLATSFISVAQAAHSADLELAGKSFSDVEGAAKSAWNERLGVITVPQADATDGQLQTLYGSLYRMNLYPNSQFENAGTASSPVYKYASPNLPTSGAAGATATNAVVKTGKIYVNNGFWDTYRTVWPLYSMLYPKLADQLVDGFVQQYRDAGWTPRWSSPGYADLMTGTSSDVAFANAYISGAIDTKTALDAFDAGLKNATTVSTAISGVGRKSLDQSEFLGYVPDSLSESVSWGLEGTINDYGLGKMAAKLATDPNTPKDRVAELKADSTYLLGRSEDFVNQFDPSIDFFQGRNADGTFQEAANEFDPASWGGAFTETDGWNFAFHAPEDVQGLAGLYGGDDKLIQKLEQFYATPETATDVGTYPGQIHEMLEAASVRIGQLGMSNQPSHHIPYIAAAAGDPSLTQQVVREVTRRLFTGSDIGEGYTGDEDNGEMSSWFVFSALGFYPLAQGSGEYTIGSPLFAHATVHLESGKTLQIDADGNSTQNVYIQSASFNGKSLNQATLKQSDVAGGGVLRFTMGSKPSDWGKGKTQGATGDNVAATAPTPLVDATKKGFGEATSSDGTNLTALTDDESLTSTTFASSTPQITWKSAQGPVTVDTYTVTSGAAGATPTGWKLEGSSNGKNWVTLDVVHDAKFDNALETRPFQISHPASLAYYRLSVTATSTGKAPTLAELELLTDTTAKQKLFTLTAAPGVKAEVGTPFSGSIAAISGPATDAADYSVTVDWQDGKGPQPVTLTKSALGAWNVPVTHTFDKAGTYTVHVVATLGTQMMNTDVNIQVARTAPSLVGAYDNVCLGQTGQAANCDFEGNGFSRTSLAQHGFVQGKTNAVPGTDLTFDLPAVTPGQPDNATGNGQVIPIPSGSGITELSVIGTATEKAQQTQGTITYSDGTTDTIPIAYGDWVGAASNPQFGDTVVATSTGRTNGVSGLDGATAAIFATPVFAVPAGKHPVTLTLPVQTGAGNQTGRIHVFAIATNGTRTASVPLSVTAGGPLAGSVGAKVSGTLATATGGAIASSTDVSATVNWGDGTALDTGATVSVADGTATVTGSHSYAAAGTYTATVTVDDGTGSAATTLKVSVTGGAAAPAPTLKTPAGRGVRAGSTAQVTGTGFAPGEQVKVLMDGKDSAATVTAASDGSVAFAVTAPGLSGNHALTALGSTSRAVATTTLFVLNRDGSNPGDVSPAGKHAAEFRIAAQAATQGTIVEFSGNGFAPGEHVTIALAKGSGALATVVANGDGVVWGTFTVPSGLKSGETRVTATSGSDTTASDGFRVLAKPAPDHGKPPVRAHG